MAVLSVAWVLVFGWLSVTRHLALGTHAEDMGFTDQVIWNFLRGQWFRMSLYEGATWNTELDLAHLARPDTLLAFHVEPMLLGFVPLYALGAGPVVLLLIQACAVGLGALPAYRLGAHFGRTAWAGLAVAVAYLLSPLGQWAVLSDFHTSTLAAPLLLLSAERILVAGRTGHGSVAAALAMSAREDVGPAVALLGGTLLLLGASRRAALTVSALGVVWTIVAVAVMLTYSGGVSPFGHRFESLAGGLPSIVESMRRPAVLSQLETLLLSGGWLSLLAPGALLPALPALLINALSSSAWMAVGKAHYSGLILPFVVLGAAVGLRRGARLLAPVLVMTSVVSYMTQGAGPLAANYAPATVTAHANLARDLATSLPSERAVSASSTLVPWVSQRARLHLFPTILDADYVFVDLRAPSAPTSPGDVYVRIRNLLAGGGWEVERAQDGLLLLRRNDAAPELNADDLPREWLLAPADGSSAIDGQLQLLRAELVPTMDGAVGVDGPRATLRTTWRANSPLAAGTSLAFAVELQGEQIHVWDVAALWWYPPERWSPGQSVTIDISDVPARRFLSWQPLVSTR